MKQLLIPLFASALVAVAPPAQAQEQSPPLGRINDTQLRVVGFVSGGVPGLFLAPTAYYAFEGDIFMWLAVGAIAGNMGWGATYMAIAAVFGGFKSKKDEGK